MAWAAEPVAACVEIVLIQIFVRGGQQVDHERIVVRRELPVLQRRALIPRAHPIVP